ncbi:MAG: ABC transporter substrate-binding protein [Campylobacter sp.]|nr:ABC transporter substrate-binding protein [Campylobacter sp.]
MKKNILVSVFLACVLGAKNLVVLDPAAVEILYMLEAESQISAISSTTMSKIYPEEKTANLPSVGTYIKPNLEKIVELNPDLIITSFHSANAGNDLKNLNFPSMELKADSLNQICQNTKKLGEITDKSQKADGLCVGVEKIFENKTALKDKSAIAFFSANPMMAFTDTTLPGDIISKFGMKNLASSLQGSTPIISSEFILSQNPDFIIMVGLNSDLDSFLKNNPILSQSKAVKNGKFIVVPSTILRGSPRISILIEQIYGELTK